MDMTENQIERRVSLEAGNLPFELVWTPQVIVIEKAQKFAGGSAYADISRRGMTSLLLFDHPNFGSVSAHELRGAITGTVIHDQDLDRPVLLNENALERGNDVPAAVVSRDYDADQSVHSLAPSVSPM